jgi:alcohol dehydrogenase
MHSFEFHPRVRVISGQGSLARLGSLAQELGFRRSLLVADRGLLAAGHVHTAVESLRKSQIAVVAFHDVPPNPDTNCVERGRALAAAGQVDSLIGLGGGSSLDCAKGINFVLTNGGRMQDYWGYGKARRPLLPMIAIPTTTGTGSEAQSFALISHSETHVKMACGDPQAAFRVAILDPLLAVSQPHAVLAAAGYDAISHAVETMVTTRRNSISICFSREAWRLLSAHYERALENPADVQTLAALQFGAFLAGTAIENSMLGAAHACANPLTARYGILHGNAIALMLAHVVRWNGAAANADYAELLHMARWQPAPGQSASECLAQRLTEFAQKAALTHQLSSAGVSKADLPLLAGDASNQWTGKFNPRPFDAAAAREVYECAW